MTKTEQKVYDYAQSVRWHYDKVDDFIYNLPKEEFNELYFPTCINNKTDYFIKKHQPKDWWKGVQELKEWAGYKEGGDYNFLTITIPIDDYDRLRKLEIKNQIKKLKKELKGL